MYTLEELQERAGGTLQKVVAEYEWTPADKNGVGFWVSIKIKISQVSEGRFLAVASHSVHKTGLATPYTAVEYGSSIEEALLSCINALSMFKGTIDDTTWKKLEDFD